MAVKNIEECFGLNMNGIDMLAKQIASELAAGEKPRLRPQRQAGAETRGRG